MKPLKGPDAFFLYTETPAQHQHTLGVLILDPSTAGSAFTIAKLRAKLESDIDDMPEFRQRLLDAPFTVVPPTLVDDPDFRMRNHFHHISCPAPGDERALSGILDDIASVPLDRSKPLWETWIVEGLERGRVAVITKCHHCVSDGVQGAEVMKRQFDLEPFPTARTKRPTHRARPESVSLLRASRLAWGTRWKTAPGIAGMVVKSVRSIRKRRKLLKSTPVDQQWLPPMLPQAPRLRFNGSITPNRAIALGNLDLGALKTIKDHFGVKLNDVVLTLCTMAIRDYLIATNDLPAEPLLAAVPVSLALKGQSEEGQGNQVGNMIVKLPVDIADPAACVAAIHASTQQAKLIFEGTYEGLFMGFASALPPVLSQLAMRGFFSKRAVESLPTSFNAVVSNFPGPPVELYMAGARLEASYPIGPVQSGAGLIVTFMSCRDRLDFSVQTCRDKLPQVWDLAESIEQYATTLLEAAAGSTSKPVRKSAKPDTARKVKRSKAGARGSNVPAGHRAEGKQRKPRHAASARKGSRSRGA